jgi:hypothetical protein
MQNGLIASTTTGNDSVVNIWKWSSSPIDTKQKEWYN